MSGRGRGRPRGGVIDAGVGPGRRSARNQPVQQSSNDTIDPNLELALDGNMPPPSSRVIKNTRGNLGAPEATEMTIEVSRRFSRRDGPPRGSSLPSINSVPNTNSEFGYSSQPEQLNPAHAAVVQSTPERGSRLWSSFPSQGVDTPSRKASRINRMKAHLSKLQSASDDLYQHIAESDREDEDDWLEEFTALQKIYDLHRKYFVTDKTNDVVLQPSSILAFLDIDEGSPEGQRITRILKLANLVSILDKIETTKQDEYFVILKLLQAWAEEFPRSYLVGIPADTSFNEGLIEHALMIRTQLTIYTLTALQAPNGSMQRHPYLEVARLWCDNNEDITVEMVETFTTNQSGLTLRPIQSSDPNLVNERNRTRLSSLIKQLQYQENADETFTVNIRSLDFPFQDFQEKLRTFIQDCFQHTRASQDITTTGSEVGSRIDSQIQSQLEAEALTQIPPLSYKNVASSHPLPSSFPPASRIPYPPGFNSPSTSQYPDTFSQDNFQGGAAFAHSAAQAAAPATADAGASRKRRAQAAPSATPGEPGQPPAKKPRGRRKKNADAGADASAVGPVVSGLPAPPPAPIEYPPLPGTQTEPDFDALTQRSREISAANRKAREPQVRSAWVRNDVRMLVRAVDEYGCKWSVIERMIKEGTIPFERPRDQQALRDKARLLKQDFLKADGLLPRGFDLVVLGKKEREAVRACGKNPDRKEADIDTSDPLKPRPINTELHSAHEEAAPAIAAIAPVAAMDAPEVPQAPVQEPVPQDAVVVQNQPEDEALAAVQADNELSALA
ncbi:hypothetical protein QBC38DRAFT_461282 [Podospora fimiseda]|uniref:Myb-like domain-containing protein n=1 Tax=Podospora fimiseda TaxID=252190 RepID=A0AAN6YRT4_9PEZI|nr:hypothetical protein QBC38DRAFT_461282 [Podospora fimiseda]